MPPRGPNPNPGARRGAPEVGMGMERRMGQGPRRDWTEVERTTFLGVEVSLVAPVLGSQLGLPNGTGLVVEHLSPRSPAAGVLKEHDVLTLLDNQILIDADEPLLFHLGQRALFADVSAAVARVVPLDRLRWLGFGHVEADENGSMNEWLAAAPNAEVAFPR